MFVVPLAGDTVETKGGVKHTVLSYAAYHKQPAVYVEGEGATTEHVLFSDITAINGTPVTLTPGKVFTADSLIKRKAQLPQVGDEVVYDGLVLKLRALKLRDHGKLTNGVLMVCVDKDTDEQVIGPLGKLERLRHGDSTEYASLRVFNATYKDYMGVTQSGGKSE